MTLVEKLDKIAKTSTVERLKADTAKDFDELWKKVIEPNLPDKDSVIGWHNLLMQYIQQDNAVFTLRACASGDHPRRGCLNRNADCVLLIPLVFCDVTSAFCGIGCATTLTFL